MYFISIWYNALSLAGCVEFKNCYCMNGLLLFLVTKSWTTIGGILPSLAMISPCKDITQLDNQKFNSDSFFILNYNSLKGYYMCIHICLFACRLDSQFAQIKEKLLEMFHYTIFAFTMLTQVASQNVPNSKHTHQNSKRPHQESLHRQFVEETH